MIITTCKFLSSPSFEVSMGALVNSWRVSTWGCAVNTEYLKRKLQFIDEFCILLIWHGIGLCFSWGIWCNRSLVSRGSIEFCSKQMQTLSSLSWASKWVAKLYSCVMNSGNLKYLLVNLAKNFCTAICIFQLLICLYLERICLW